MDDVAWTYRHPRWSADVCGYRLTVRRRMVRSEIAYRWYATRPGGAIVDSPGAYMTLERAQAEAIAWARGQRAIEAEA